MILPQVLRHYHYRHAKLNPYKCGHCKFDSVESGKVIRHIHSHHPGLPMKVIKRTVAKKAGSPEEDDGPESPEPEGNVGLSLNAKWMHNPWMDGLLIITESQICVSYPEIKYNLYTNTTPLIQTEYRAMCRYFHKCVEMTQRRLCLLFKMDCIFPIQNAFLLWTA